MAKSIAASMRTVVFASTLVLAAVSLIAVGRNASAHARGKAAGKIAGTAGFNDVAGAEGLVGAAAATGAMGAMGAARCGATTAGVARCERFADAFAFIAIHKMPPSMAPTANNTTAIFSKMLNVCQRFINSYARTSTTNPAAPSAERRCASQLVR